MTAYGANNAFRRKKAKWAQKDSYGMRWGKQPTHRPTLSTIIAFTRICFAAHLPTKFAYCDGYLEMALKTSNKFLVTGLGSNTRLCRSDRIGFDGSQSVRNWFAGVGVGVVGVVSFTKPNLLRIDLTYRIISLFCQESMFLQNRTKQTSPFPPPYPTTTTTDVAVESFTVNIDWEKLHRVNAKTRKEIKAHDERTWFFTELETTQWKKTDQLAATHHIFRKPEGKSDLGSYPLSNKQNWPLICKLFSSVLVIFGYGSLQLFKVTQFSPRWTRVIDSRTFRKLRSAGGKKHLRERSG